MAHQIGSFPDRSPDRMPSRLPRAGAVFLGMLLALAAPAVTGASSSPPPGEGSTPPRLSAIEGDVSFWRPGAEDWARARLNIPLAPGDHLFAGAGGRLEIQFESEACLRADAGTDVGLENVEPDYWQFRVAEGRVALDLRDLSRGAVVEIDTPQAAFTIDTRGYYRVDVAGSTTRFVTRRGGRATVSPAGGPTSEAVASSTVIVEDGDPPRVATYGVPDFDGWDQWNYERGRLAQSAESSRYVAAGVYGTDSLDRYGSWRTVTDYGPVWVPRSVAPGWAPYSAGQWLYDPWYGWSWIDDSPWGWAPFHYGRWVYLDRYWGWAPGPLVTVPFYAPALVGFYGTPGFSVGLNVGVGPVGWVALGWGEPLYPWWGPVGFVGAPCWRGWGGPRIVNEVVVHHEYVVHHVDEIRYVNRKVPGAVVTVPGDKFGGSRIADVRLTTAHRNLRPVGGSVPVSPDSHSLVPADGSGGRAAGTARPPRQVLQRRVVATREPRDPSPRLGAAGLAPGSDSALPSPRLVSPVTRRAPRSVESLGTSAGGAGGPPRPDRGGESRRPRPAADVPAPPRMDGNISVPPRREVQRPERTLPRRDDRPAVQRRFGDDESSNGTMPRALPRRPSRFEAPPPPAAPLPREQAPSDGSDSRYQRRPPLPERFDRSGTQRLAPPRHVMEERRLEPPAARRVEAPIAPPRVVPEPPAAMPEGYAPPQRSRAPREVAPDDVRERRYEAPRRAPAEVAPPRAEPPSAPLPAPREPGFDFGSGRGSDSSPTFRSIGRERPSLPERFGGPDSSPPFDRVFGGGSDDSGQPRDRRGGPRRPRDDQ